MRNEKGITLIALVITIIVLLILAGVSISMVIGDNGVLNNARKSSVKTEIQAMKEDIEFKHSEYVTKLYAYNAHPSEEFPIKSNYLDLIPEKYKKDFEVSSDGVLVYVGAESGELADIVEELNIASDKNSFKDEFILKIDELWNLAVAYKASNSGISDSEAELFLQYIRNKRSGYTDSLWSGAAGAINTGFVSYVQSENSELASYNFNNAKASSSDTDFVHMVAALNTLLHDPSQITVSVPVVGNQTMNLPDEFTGWAGDLVTLMGEVMQYDATGSISETDLVTYAKGILAVKGVNSSFGYEDMVADIDAVNLYSIYNNSTEKNFAKIIFNYYYFGGNFLKNKTDFVDSLNLNSATLKDYVISEFNSNSLIVGGILKANFSMALATRYAVPANSVKYTNVVAQAFNDYFN